MLGDYLLVLRRRCAAALYRERNQPRPARPGLPEREPVRQGRHQRLCGAGPAGHGESRPDGNEGVGPLPVERRPRPVGPDAAAPHRPVPRRSGPGNPLRSGLRPDPGRPAARGGRVLPVRDPALGLSGCRQCHAPGHRRHALDQAVLTTSMPITGWRNTTPTPSITGTATSGTGSGST